MARGCYCTDRREYETQVEGGKKIIDTDTGDSGTVMGMTGNRDR